ncbi:MAG: polysaccharide biosynthesis C-terminal domain-containing protein, partial [Lachnospiraceae bacterium]|nr:polysaccharide biosynthesis C-terminal domain-containing protein [Lachnospiraceae bacterium]
GLRTFVANSVWLGAAFSAVITALPVALCPVILRLMDTPSDIIDDAYAYIVVIFIGIPTVFLYNILSGIIRALGDSRTPVFFLVFSSLVNIGLDLLFIVHFKMGVEGAAWATVISQGLSGVLCLVYMIKKFEILRIKKEEWKPELHLMGSLCSMGIPMGLQYSITAIGSVVLQTAVNGLGSVAVASVTAANKIGAFLACPFDAMGSTMATYGGQNVGARKLRRVKEGLYDCIKLGAVYAVIGFLIAFFFGAPLGKLFVEAEDTALVSQIVKDVRLFLIITTAFYFPLALVNIIRFMIQGIGFPTFAILAGVLEMVPPALAGFVRVPVFGFPAAALGSP